MSALDEFLTDNAGMMQFIKKKMEAMTEDERMEFMGLLWGKYCKYCGREQGPEACQCWNDE